MRGQIGGRYDRSGQNVSASDRRPASDSAAASDARVREMVLVTKHRMDKRVFGDPAYGSLTIFSGGRY
jgi:hypothetical protein